MLRPDPLCSHLQFLNQRPQTKHIFCKPSSYTHKELFCLQCSFSYTQKLKKRIL